MLSANDIKVLRKLRLRKHRWQQKRFSAEGPKVVGDLLKSGLQPLRLWSTAPQHWPGAEEISEAQLAQISNLTKPNEVLALFPFPHLAPTQKTPALILSALKDPGNLGTLLRSADWFGFGQIFCSPGTADVYNSKTVQSTMGSLGRVAVHYLPDHAIAEQLQATHRLLRADMQGLPLDQYSGDGTPVALVLGSESHGPQAFWRSAAEAITIPKRGNSQVESLNVAVAGSILMQALSAR